MSGFAPAAHRPTQDDRFVANSLRDAQGPQAVVGQHFSIISREPWNLRMAATSSPGRPYCPAHTLRDYPRDSIPRNAEINSSYNEDVLINAEGAQPWRSAIDKVKISSISRIFNIG
eukprot:2324708-Pleurochrysis_carterae.AAC.2